MFRRKSDHDGIESQHAGHAGIPAGVHVTIETGTELYSNIYTRLAKQLYLV